MVFYVIAVHPTASFPSSQDLAFVDSQMLELEKKKILGGANLSY